MRQIANIRRHKDAVLRQNERTAAVLEALPTDATWISAKSLADRLATNPAWSDLNPKARSRGVRRLLESMGPAAQVEVRDGLRHAKMVRRQPMVAAAAV
jgi:hypothetical protein